MKLLTGNGKTLEVRDVGPVIMRIIARAIPIKFNRIEVLEDDAARVEVKRVIEARDDVGQKLYDVETK